MDRNYNLTVLKTHQDFYFLIVYLCDGEEENVYDFRMHKCHEIKIQIGLFRNVTKIQFREP